MGIRFECPNGHKLNVKAFLAGKRGICPDCDAKFLVPESSGGKAVAVDVAAEAQTTSPAAPPVAASDELPATIDQSLPDTWYVRPASGEQYGPADTELMRAWAAEGRIAADSWVWRTGWDKWKIAHEVLGTFQSAPTAEVSSEVPPSDSEIEIERPSSARTFTPRPHKSRAENRREQARKLSVALGTLILVLAAALGLVLWFQS
jgi:hypothetical protein